MQRTEQIICIICIIIAAAMFAAAGIIAATPATPAPREIHQITRRVFRRKPKKETKMLMTKVRIEDLPTTATAGLDPDVSPNPHCDINNGAGGVNWSVTKISPDTAAIADETSPNGWSVAPGGVIGIPDGIEYGKYQAVYASPSPDGVCDDNENFGYVYHYIFKIVPPCPTGVTLTATPR